MRKKSKFIPKYNHKDYYRDNIIFGKQKLDETEKNKDITFGTTDQDDINKENIRQKSEKNEGKRKESFGKGIGRWWRENKGEAIFRIITVVIIGGLGFLFTSHFSQDKDIALINKDIEYIKDDLKDLKGNGKITDEDYNYITSQLNQLDIKIENSKKDIELINKDINHIKDMLKKY